MRMGFGTQRAVAQHLHMQRIEELELAH
jgi:hypothetical protein